MASSNITLVVRAQKTRNVYEEKTFELVIAPKPVWSTDSPLPNAALGDAVSYGLVASGASTYEIVNGKLPTGLTMSSAGALTGTATTEQTTFFTVRAIRAGTGTIYTDKQFALTTSRKPEWLSASAMGTYPTKSAFSETLLASFATEFTSSSLPQGLSLSSRGLLQGSVSEPWSGAFTVRAWRTSSVFIDRTFSLAFGNVPTWSTPAALPDIAANASALVTLVAQGASAYTVVQGKSPVPLLSNGNLTGVPSESRMHEFTVRASTGTRVYADRTFRVCVTEAPLWVTQALPTVVRGEDFGLQLRASYADQYTCASMPQGMQLSVDGILSGRVNTASVQLTVRASRIRSSLYTDKTFNMTFEPRPVWSTPAKLPDAAASEYYSTALAAVNASKYEVISGKLPSSLSLSGTGVLSGTAGGKAGTASFLVRATNADTFSDKLFTLTVATRPQWTTDPQLDDIAVGETHIIMTSATPAGKYALVLNSIPPPGLTFESWGALTGSATATGSYVFTARAYSYDSDDIFQDQAFAIVAGKRPVWQTGPDLGGVPTTPAANIQLLATDAASYASASMPSDLRVSSTTGLLTGDPKVLGVNAFTVRAIGVPATLYADRVFQLYVRLTWLTPQRLADVETGASMTSVTLVAQYAEAYATQFLPAGLTLSSTGLLGGTPTASGTATFTVTASKSVYTADRTFTLHAASRPAWNTGVSLGKAVKTGTDVTFALSALCEGGTLSYTLSSPIAGVAVSGSTLSVAVATPPAGNLSIPVTATNTTANGLVLTSERTFTLLLISAPTWSGSTDLGAVAINQSIPAISIADRVTGLDAITLSGTPTAGVSIQASGTLSGTPTVSGTRSFNALAAISAPNGTASSERTFTIEVVDAPAWVTGTDLGSVDAGSSFAVTLQANASKTVVYGKSLGAYPDGIALSGATLSGTSSSTGSYTFTIDASIPQASMTYSQLLSTARAFSLTVKTVVKAPEPTPTPTPAPATPYTITFYRKKTDSYPTFPGAYDSDASSKNTVGTALNKSVNQNWFGYMTLKVGDAYYRMVAIWEMNNGNKGPPYLVFGNPGETMPVQVPLNTGVSFAWEHTSP